MTIYFVGVINRGEYSNWHFQLGAVTSDVGQCRLFFEANCDMECYELYVLFFLAAGMKESLAKSQINKNSPQMSEQKVFFCRNYDDIINYIEISGAQLIG